jgi:hypothetical protein
VLLPFAAGAVEAARFSEAPSMSYAPFSNERPETGFEDEPTLIQVGDDDFAAPPALPFPLTRAKARADAWLDDLPPEARRVLELARLPAPAWPFGDRVPGAVAVPDDDAPPAI